LEYNSIVHWVAIIVEVFLCKPGNFTNFLLTHVLNLEKRVTYELVIFTTKSNPLLKDVVVINILMLIQDSRSSSSQTT